MTHRESHASVGRELDALLGESALTRRRTPSPSEAPRLQSRKSAASRRPLRIAAAIVAGGIATGAVLNLAIAPPVPVVREGASVGRPQVAAKAGDLPTAPVAPTVPVAPPVEIASLPPEMPDDADDTASPVPASRPTLPPAAAPAATSPRPRVVQARVARAEARSSEPCQAGEESSRCRYEALVMADQQLAAAYDRAADAGVDVRDLRALRREWIRARSYAEDDPAGVADAYERMAADLRGLVRERIDERASL